MYIEPIVKISWSFARFPSHISHTSNTSLHGIVTRLTGPKCFPKTQSHLTPMKTLLVTSLHRAIIFPIVQWVFSQPFRCSFGVCHEDRVKSLHYSFYSHMEYPGRRSKSKGGEVVCVEPRSLEIVNYDPAIRMDFEKIRCMDFYENI